MNIEEFKRKSIRERLDVDETFGNIFVFIDFSNVNKWFESDRQDWNNRQLKNNEFLSIDIEKLEKFSEILGGKTKIYYGENPLNSGSCKFTDLLRIFFGKRNVITKNIQKIKHYLCLDDNNVDSKYEKIDKEGKKFIEIRKCNFDVEITVDAIKMINHYDTFCIFSGDSDFIYLNNFLKQKGKKIIVVKGGYITSELRETADIIINAQQIKKDITKIAILKNKDLK